MTTNKDFHNEAWKAKEAFEDVVLKYEKELKEQKSAIALSAQKKFHHLSKEFLKGHPSIMTFEWGQYEPWRDGEDTEFEILCSVDDIRVNGLSYWDLTDEEHDVWGKKFDSVSSFLGEFNEDVLEFVFGHGAKIKVSLEKIEIEEYSDG